MAVVLVTICVIPSYILTIYVALYILNTDIPKGLVDSVFTPQLPTLDPSKYYHVY